MYDGEVGLVDKVIGFVNEIVFEDGLVMGGSLHSNAKGRKKKNSKPHSLFKPLGLRRRRVLELP